MRDQHKPSGVNSDAEIIQWQSDKIEHQARQLTAATLVNEALNNELLRLLDDIEALNSIVREKHD